MDNHKYEIENVNFGRNMHHENIIGMLTGLPLDEINVALKKLDIIKSVTLIKRHLYDLKAKDIWYTRDYLNTFHALGFNTNPRFKKFDPETEYPCIMRCKEVGTENGYWYGWVYNDGKVYDTSGQIWPFDGWIEAHKNEYRVTSMLQVWI